MKVGKMSSVLVQGFQKHVFLNSLFTIDIMKVGSHLQFNMTIALEEIGETGKYDVHVNTRNNDQVHSKCAYMYF